MKQPKIIFIALAFLMICTFSCKKDVVTQKDNLPISGLWVGQYTFKSQPPLFFSFSIYPDGTMSYKCLGDNNYIFYANGSWALKDSIFTYIVTTTNTPGALVQPTQSGNAIYRGNDSLTGGVNTDLTSGDSGNFNMKRAN